MLPDIAAQGGQSSHERLPKAWERLMHVYRCLRVYLLCDRSYKPILPRRVLPGADEMVKQSALRRLALQKLWVHTNSLPTTLARDFGLP